MNFRDVDKAFTREGCQGVRLMDESWCPLKSMCGPECLGWPPQKRGRGAG